MLDWLESGERDGRIFELLAGVMELVEVRGLALDFVILEPPGVFFVVLPVVPAEGRGGLKGFGGIFTSAGL